MFRRRRFQKRPQWQPRTYINEWIRISPVRLIDENGENVGIIETSQALKMAKDKGLDLIEISPTAKPPVCRIMSFGKFKYLQTRQSKKQKGQQKNTRIKTIRLGLSTSSTDLETKSKQVGKFIEKGYKVKIDINLRGREKALLNIAREKLEGFIKILPIEVKLEQEIKKQPRGLNIVVIKNPSAIKKKSSKIIDTPK